MTGATSTRAVLIVLWIPSADREGKKLSDQNAWKENALQLFGKLFGGATAMPPCEGIWRDDERGGALIREAPILVECYVTEAQAVDKDLMGKLGVFCKKMGKGTRQGEVALLADGQWQSFKHFS